MLYGQLTWNTFTLQGKQTKELVWKSFAYCRPNQQYIQQWKASGLHQFKS
jgi:hypothetical protein